ncbi:UNVERIFIED_CONTAM: hypothetical protein FKN15_044389 [Acipenser sinensis]
MVDSCGTWSYTGLLQGRRGSSWAPGKDWYVTALQLSADYTPHCCKLHAVPDCVTANSPDTDTQPSTLVLCPQYLVLDSCGTLGSSVPQIRRLEVLRAPCFGALGGLGTPTLHNIGASVLQDPRYLKGYTPRCLDTSRFFKPVQ